MNKDNNKPPTATLYGGLEGEVAKPGKHIHPLLFELLENGTPFGDEDVITGIIFRYLEVCGAKKKHGMSASTDRIGNVWVTIPPAMDVLPTTLFTSHMDTVHPKYTPVKLMSSTGPKEADKGFIFGITPDKNVRCILGADDKVGVYIMLRMIERGIVGTYAFHVGEEKGCKGSTYVAEQYPDLLKQFKHAVAFDRANYGDVIASQAPGIGTSPAFVTALSAQLNTILDKSMPKREAKYRFSTAVGAMTDTGKYFGHIPECTNLSVAYFDQHSPRERFDIMWLEDTLLPAILDVNWGVLPAVRDPSKPPVRPSYSRAGGNFTGGKMYNKLYDALPTYLEMEPDWDLLDGLDYSLDASDHRRMIRKWLHRKETEQVTQMLRLMERTSTDEEVKDSSMDIIYDLFTKLCDTIDDAGGVPIEETKEDLEDLKTIIEEFIDDATTMPVAPLKDPSVTIAKDAPNLDDLGIWFDDELMRFFQKREDGTSWNPVGMHTADGVLVETEMLDKKMKFQKGTRLFFKMKNDATVLLLGHTVTGFEPFFNKSGVKPILPDDPKKTEDSTRHLGLRGGSDKKTVSEPLLPLAEKLTTLKAPFWAGQIIFCREHRHLPQELTAGKPYLVSFMSQQPTSVGSDQFAWFVHIAMDDNGKKGIFAARRFAKNMYEDIPILH
jgi:uncharacterized protein YaaR (DUF327 family)